MAILSVCGEPWGGSEELWFEAACALRDAGHGVDVFKTNVDRAQPRVRELCARGCAVADLNLGGPRLLWHAMTAPSLRPVTVPLQLALRGPRLRLRSRPDLAVVSQGGNYDGVNFARVCQRLGLPYVLVSQKASAIHWPQDRVRAYIRAVHEDALRTVFVSERNLRLTQLQLDADLPRAEVLANPVLAGHAGPLAWPGIEGPLRLACVGRLFVLEKGQDLLLETLARPHWRKRGIRLSLYGDGLNREGLEGMARRLGLEGVTFHGHVDDIESVWRDHHALILPSRAEGAPLVVHEAMACGRVPIVADVGGAAEVVDDGVTGFVAEGAGAAGLDAALERAWGRRDEWEAIGQRACRRVADMRRARGHAPLAALVMRELDRIQPGTNSSS